MIRALGQLLFAALLSLALALLMMWPQALSMSTHLASHYDPLFSTWRVAWFAHALATAPRQLFNGNIFTPSPWAMAYSDATLLEGAVGAPFLWSGISPVLVYNVLLLAGFVGSGVAAFGLARSLTGSFAASLIAAAAFTVTPYRLEHYMHLELQWTMFIPLTLWALHHAVASGKKRWGAVAGVCLWLQVLACVYYGVFLALTLTVFAPALMLLIPRVDIKRAAIVIAVAAGVALLLTIPAAIPYALAARVVGGRPEFEIARYSATSGSYFAVSPLNLVWGWTGDRWGSAELRLFPGLTCLVLAVIALVARRPRRPVFLYAIVVIVAIAFSFGWNNPLYRLFAQLVTPLQGLRSLSRFAAIMNCGLAVLAAFGMQVLLERARWSGSRRAVAAGIAIAAMTVESLHQPIPLITGPGAKVPDLYRVLRSAPAGAVVELPVPRLGNLPGFDPTFEAWSIWHWKPLVNGYSGYYPRDYVTTMIRMEIFPEDASINRLRGHGVRYVVVHRALFAPDRLDNLMLRFAGRPELKYWGAYDDPVGTADLYELLD